MIFSPTICQVRVFDDKAALNSALTGNKKTRMNKCQHLRMRCRQWTNTAYLATFAVCVPGLISAYRCWSGMQMMLDPLGGRAAPVKGRGGQSICSKKVIAILNCLRWCNKTIIILHAPCVSQCKKWNCGEVNYRTIAVTPIDWLEEENFSFILLSILFATSFFDTLSLLDSEPVRESNELWKWTFSEIEETLTDNKFLQVRTYQRHSWHC